MFDHKSFSTISKTAKIIGVQSHVLRFWEKKFFSINPKKSLSGRRYYSSKDIQILLRIKKLLYEEGFTIKGAVNFIDKKNDMIIENNNSALNKKINKITNLLKEGTNLIKKNMY
tara:strand:+ start:109 stop:450 length:342 start_codon:yes stop_codon:yes gene_type:complete